MDLYIRSQNKLILTKYETLELCQNPDGTWFFNSGLILGKYKTKERALEILDEIQKRLKSNVSYKKNSLYLSNGYNYFEIPYEESSQVYEMPQD